MLRFVIHLCSWQSFRRGVRGASKNVGMKNWKHGGNNAPGCQTSGGRLNAAFNQTAKHPAASDATRAKQRPDQLLTSLAPALLPKEEARGSRDDHCGLSELLTAFLSASGQSDERFKFELRPVKASSIGMPMACWCAVKRVPNLNFNSPV